MKSISITIFCLLLLPCFLNAQEITFEKLREYVKPLNEMVNSIGQAFHQFEMVARKADSTGMKAAFNDFKRNAALLNEKVNSTRPMEADNWFLPEVKAYTNAMMVIAREDLPIFMNYWRSGPSAGKLETEFNKIRYDYGLYYERVYWGQQRLIANKLYKKQSAALCHGSGILVEESRNHFRRLNAGPVAGKIDLYKVSDLLPGAISGEIRTKYSDTVARFVMFKHPEKKEAYIAFNNLVYSVLSCGDDKEMHIDEHHALLDNYEEVDQPKFEMRRVSPGLNLYITLESEFDENSKATLWTVNLHYKIPYGS